MTVPKCTSIWGHKFEARYSYGGLEGDFKLEAVDGGYLSPASVVALNRSAQETTYVGDICVRCGHVVEHKTPAKSTD